MEAHKERCLKNKAWVQEKVRIRPNFFERQVETQGPEFMSIGCPGSGVSTEDITSIEPGECSGHRNIANLVVHTDPNLLRVLQYAVEVLKLKHGIVRGDYTAAA
jgi:carbonic anhydrase